MNLNLLTVSNEEQGILLPNGYSVVLRFDMIYKKWFFDMYNGDEIVYAGIRLEPDAMALDGIFDAYVALVDSVGTKEEYEPYTELGGRLSCVEVTE